MLTIPLRISLAHHNLQLTLNVNHPAKAKAKPNSLEELSSEIIEEQATLQTEITLVAQVIVANSTQMAIVHRIISVTNKQTARRKGLPEDILNRIGRLPLNRNNAVAMYLS